MKLFILTLLVQLLTLFSIKADTTNQFFIKDHSKWVKKVDYNSKIDKSTLDIEDGAVYLLADYQINVETSERYYRHVIQIINESGSENYADIWVDYDPSYQKLTFHTITITRNGVTQNRIDKSKFKIIQNESELDIKIFNGSYSAGYYIEDVRVGDVVEYSYTIKGENPIFDGKYFDMLYLQFSTQVLKVHRRVLCPKNIELYIKGFNTSSEPFRSDENGYINLVWEVENVPELIMNDMLPSWYSPYPRIQISSYSKWNDVITWAQKLYPYDVKPDEDLKTEISRITAEISNQEEKINALIQYVKEKIRYVGIEISEHSHKPRNPNDVFTKRFGDCKEKSLLLVTMLRSVGVESYVALVNTYFKQKVEEHLPTPTIFNHAIVALKYEGKIYFVDPTYTNQKGSFVDFYNGNYHKALVIGNDFSGLSEIESTSNEKIVVKEQYTIPDTIGPVKYEVNSVYYGSEADRLRSAFKTKTKKELENSFLNFYSSSYHDMKMVEPLGFKDDTIRNIVELTEKYLIGSFWEYDSTSSVDDYVAYIDATNLKYYVSVPDQRNRTHPFSQYHPVHIDNEIVFKHSKDINIDLFDKKIDNPNFTFSYKTSKIDKKTIVFNYSYQSLKDYVDSTEMATYFKDVNLLQNETYYSFTWGKESQDSLNINWVFVVLTCFLVLILVYLAINFYKRDIPTAGSVNPLQIGGWLILPSIGVLITPIYLLVSFVSSDYFNLTSWEFVSSKSSVGYDFYWALAYFFELIISCFFIVYSVLLLILLVNRRTIFPVHFIAFRILNVALLVVDFILISSIDNPNFSKDNTAIKELLRSVLGSMIWIPYMIYSERVKETFITRFKKIEKANAT